MYVIQLGVSQKMSFNYYPLGTYTLYTSKALYNEFSHSRSSAGKSDTLRLASSLISSSVPYDQKYTFASELELTAHNNSQKALTALYSIIPKKPSVGQLFYTH